MTLAAAVVTTGGCAVAADIQLVTLSADKPSLGSARKTAAGDLRVATVAGIVATPAGSLNEVLPTVVQRLPVDHAAQRFVEAAGAIYAPYAADILTLFQADDVVWEAVVAGWFADQTVGALILTGNATNGTIALDVRTVPATPTAQVVMLGARHPMLAPYDLRHHEAHPDAVRAAELTRSPRPPDPKQLPDHPAATAGALQELVQSAVRRQADAERPPWWPPDLPVAGGTVTLDTISFT